VSLLSDEKGAQSLWLLGLHFDVVDGAPGGPRRVHATSRLTSSAGPSNTASTRPSRRLRTHPLTPYCTAIRRHVSRKYTP
jgi:hypothetical protein